MDRLRRFLSRFRRDESGSIAVESMLMIPVLVWCYLGTFVFFDAFRMQSKNIKAAYTIADTLSRETGYVTANYLTGLFGLHHVLLDTPEPRGMVVTVFTFRAADNTYRVRWSQARGVGVAALTNATLGNLSAILPEMTDGEVAILVRSRVDYDPDYDVGITDFAFDEYSISRPRFAPQLCWNTVENGGIATAVC